LKSNCPSMAACSVWPNIPPPSFKQNCILCLLAVTCTYWRSKKCRGPPGATPSKDASVSNEDLQEKCGPVGVLLGISTARLRSKRRG
jgi:hypothetical protein